MLFRAAMFLACLVPLLSPAAPLVAVASNLTHPVERLQAAFEHRTGNHLSISYGSSGNFTRQILQGAAFDMFIAAGGDYVQRLQAAGLVQNAPVTLAMGRVCVFIPRTSSLADVSGLGELSRMLAGGSYQRLALPNPDFAPYGVAARQALQHMGIWALDRRRVLLGENAAQAVQFTLSGDVDLGVIPVSYAQVSAIAHRGRCLDIPQDWHDVLAQQAVLLKRVTVETRDFLDYLAGADGRAVFAAAGYTLPERQVP